MRKPNVPLEDFVSHLEEFRRRLLVSLLAFGGATVLCLFFSGQLLDFFIKPLQEYGDLQLFFQKPYEAFLTHLKVAALGGIFLASPIIFSQVWLFVAPGLYDSEKKILTPLILVSVLLFSSGAFFAYQVVIPWGLRFLLSYQTESLRPLLGVGPYFSFLMGTIIAFGVLFEFPIVMVGLVQLQIAQTKDLARSRRLIIVLIFVAAAVLTPSPDPVSQVFLAVPLMILFEISLWVCQWVEKRKNS
ncbi:MAG: twin-arginine translocase subunit TatC [Candidatus Omnitrophica bacterium]|nr:twin-arginine translocase subunit TatC [Candidatus Omnitrophota bacterium]